MTQDEKELKKRNNRRDAQLCRENKEYMTKIICCLRDEDVPDMQVEDIRQDITDMLLDAQERGEKAETVLGEDYRTFCGEILESIRPGSQRPGSEEVWDFADVVSVCGNVLLRGSCRAENPAAYALESGRISVYAAVFCGMDVHKRRGVCDSRKEILYEEKLF